MLTARQARETTRGVTVEPATPSLEIEIENKIRELLSLVKTAAENGNSSVTLSDGEQYKSGGDYYHVAKVLQRLGYTIEWPEDGPVYNMIVSW